MIEKIEKSNEENFKKIILEKEYFIFQKFEKSIFWTMKSSKAGQLNLGYDFLNNLNQNLWNLKTYLHSETYLIGILARLANIQFDNNTKVIETVLFVAFYQCFY